MPAGGKDEWVGPNSNKKVIALAIVSFNYDLAYWSERLLVDAKCLVCGSLL